MSVNGGKYRSGLFKDKHTMRLCLHNTIGRHAGSVMQMPHVTGRQRKAVFEGLQLMAQGIHDDNDHNNDRVLAAMVVTIVTFFSDSTHRGTVRKNVVSFNYVYHFYHGIYKLGCDEFTYSTDLSLCGLHITFVNVPHTAGCPWQLEYKQLQDGCTDHGLDCEHADCIVNWYNRAATSDLSRTFNTVEPMFSVFPYRFIFCGKGRRESALRAFRVSLVDDGVITPTSYKSRIEEILRRVADTLVDCPVGYADSLPENVLPRVTTAPKLARDATTIVATHHLKMLSLHHRGLVEYPDDTPALFLSKEVKFRLCCGTLRMYIFVDVCLELSKQPRCLGS